MSGAAEVEVLKATERDEQGSRGRKGTPDGIQPPDPATRSSPYPTPTQPLPNPTSRSP